MLQMYFLNFFSCLQRTEQDVDASARLQRLQLALKVGGTGFSLGGENRVYKTKQVSVVS